MDETLSNHKLCGFLCAVLAVSPSQRELSPSLGFRQRCEIFGDGCEVGFRSENGLVLAPVDSVPKLTEPVLVPPPDLEQCKVLENDSRVDSNCNGGITPRDSAKNDVSVGDSRSTRKRRTRRIGVVNGSISVVHQLHALVSRRCMKIDAFVLWDEVGACGDVRAVILVDVYLPIAVWSGWQFPKSGSIAGFLFEHLRLILN